MNFEEIWSLDSAFAAVSKRVGILAAMDNALMCKTGRITTLSIYVLELESSGRQFFLAYY